MSKHTGNTASNLVPLLKKDILNGFFKADEKLAMSALKNRYGVGIGPLRESLSQLVVEKLVVVEDQRGFRVPPILREEMLDLYWTRGHIEAMCVVQAIKKGDIDWEANVIAAMHRMQKSNFLITGDFSDVLEWEAKHQDFHTAIACGCGSETLLQIRQSLYERTARYRFLWLRQNMVTKEYFDTVHSDHQELLDCVLKRDHERAEQIMFSHLQAPQQALDKQLQD